MFDPLSESATPFANDNNQSWKTSTHEAVVDYGPPSPLPPSTPQKGPGDGLYGKEPQIYGQPEPGLISPRQTVGSNGTNFEKPEPYLRVRITGLDRNRRDILIRLDAQTNLSNFTGTTYRNVSRSYFECQQFYESIVQNNPQTIVPALPLAQTSAPTDEEDDRLVKIMLQRWLSRICENPILLHDEDVRAFIESDFGYQPLPRPRRKGSSGFGLIRRGVPDEDEDLQRARFELTKLETQFFDSAKAIDKLAMARKSMALAHSEMGNKLINVATTEAHQPLGNAFRKIGRAWHSLADLDQAQAISECVVIGDTLGYQGMNARSAKETLLMRTGVLEEYQAAVKTTISKRRNIERLKASSNIRPDRVDEALEDMEEANKYEQVLAKRAEGISQNLHVALQTHNRLANDDITTALVEHARSSIMYERQLLRELEALRTDVNNAAKKVVPQSNGVPRPSVIPPLEDFTKPPGPKSALPPSSNAGRGPGGFGQGPLSSSQSFTRPPPQSADPGVSSFTKPGPQGPLGPPSQSVAPPSQTYVKPAQKPPQSPGAGPSTSPGPSQITFAPPPEDDGPPLGGKFVDGTKSMFVKPPTSPSPLGQTPATPSASAQFNPLQSPLHPNPLGRTATMPAVPDSPTRGLNGRPAQSDGLDPLGQIKPSYMSQSMRVTPSRQRLDAREAASKLANMF